MAWLVGGGIVLYYIVLCRPNVVNTAERTVTINCITFATISFLFISAVFVVFMVYYFPLCQPVFRLVSAITLWPPRSLAPLPNSRPLSPVPACFQAGVSNHASLTTSTAFLAVSATFTPLRSAWVRRPVERSTVYDGTKFI